MGRTLRTSAPTVSVVRADGDMRPVGSDWGSFLAWTRQPAASWFHASNLGGDRFYELVDAAEVPREEIDRPANWSAAAWEDFEVLADLVFRQAG